MKLNSYHLEDLRAAQRGDLSITSEGFVFDGNVIGEGSERDRLDFLWMNDYIDADTNGIHEPAVVVLTGKGELELARVEQETQR